MKVTPRIAKRYKTVDYTDLKPGEAFMYADDLYIKHNHDGPQVGICLNDKGCQIDDMCGEQVIPVNAEIKWSYPKKSLAKKK